MLSIRKPSRKTHFAPAPKTNSTTEINNMSLRLSGVPGFPLGAIKKPIAKIMEQRKAPAIVCQ